MTVPVLALTESAGPGGCAARRARALARHVDDPVGERGARCSPSGIRVIAWDLPGHGAVARPRATRSPSRDLADAVADAIGASGADRAFYAGVSLGGATGLELLLRHP